MQSRTRDAARLWVCVALGFVPGACAQTGWPASRASTVAEILWLPVGARLSEDAASPVLVRNGRSIYIDGSGAVAFSLTADCVDVAKDISQYFERTEWQPRSTQDLNPGMATSFSSGCEPQGGGGLVIELDSNGHQIPYGPYFKWHGEWQNDAGDILTYIVGGTGQELSGYASYVPRHLVDKR